MPDWLPDPVIAVAGLAAFSVAVVFMLSRLTRQPDQSVPAGALPATDDAEALAALLKRLATVESKLRSVTRKDLIFAKRARRWTKRLTSWWAALLGMIAAALVSVGVHWVGGVLARQVGWVP